MNKKKNSTKELILKKKYRITDVGLVIDKNISKQELLEIGKMFINRTSTLAWQIGDWSLTVIERYGRGDLEKLSARLGMKTSALRGMRGICSAYPIEQRRKNLTFHHHRVAVSLPQDKRKEYLDKAEKGNLNAYALSRLVKTKASVYGFKSRRAVLLRVLCNNDECLLHSESGTCVASKINVNENGKCIENEK